MTLNVSTFAGFMRGLIERGLEHFKLYYSIYPGSVADNQDPECKGRLRVSVPAVYGNDVPEYWAFPCGAAASGVNSGVFDIPAIGDPVWVQFQMGRPRFPVWSPGWWGEKSGENEVPWNARRLPPTTATWRQKCGHRLEFRNKDGEQRVLLIAKDGSYIDIDVANLAIEIFSKTNLKEQVAQDVIRFVGANLSEEIKRDCLKIIGGSDTQKVSGDRKHFALGSAEDCVIGNDKVYVGGNLSIHAAGKVSIRGNAGVYVDGSTVLINQQLADILTPSQPPESIEEPLSEEAV